MVSTEIALLASPIVIRIVQYYYVMSNKIIHSNLNICKIFDFRLLFDISKDIFLITTKQNYLSII